MFTAAEIDALAKKARATGTAGVFSLDQLKALGQTGNLKMDWMRGAAPAAGALIAGGGRGMIPADIPAGYYQVPGLDGAYYYDPKSGQAPQQFIDWANNLKASDRDPFTGAPKALIPNTDSGEVFRAQAGQQPAAISTLNDIFKLGRGADGTYQDAQDRVLGLGKYQQFITGKDGKQIRLQDVPGYTPPPPQFTDVSKPQAGAFDRLMGLTGQDKASLDKTLGLVNGKENASYWTKMENALAANYETNALKWKGLQEERAARGLDPETGTSLAEKKRIYDTYNRIQDPAERAAYIKMQDPGNLTAELRQARYETRAGERAAIAAYEKANPNVVYDSASRYGGPSDSYMQVAVTMGHGIMTDKVTGRETFVGNIPTGVSLVKQNTGNFDAVAKRLGGGIGGAFLGFMTGNVPGAFLGAYMGAGGWRPNAKNISAKNSRGWGQWQTTQAQGLDIRTVGTALLFARLTGSGMFSSGNMGGSAVLTAPQRAGLFMA